MDMLEQVVQARIAVLDLVEDDERLRLNFHFECS
jgi:hypothetical protein